MHILVNLRQHRRQLFSPLLGCDGGGIILAAGCSDTVLLQLRVEAVLVHGLHLLVEELGDRLVVLDFFALIRVVLDVAPILAPDVVEDLVPDLVGLFGEGLGGVLLLAFVELVRHLH